VKKIANGDRLYHPPAGPAPFDRREKGSRNWLPVGLLCAGWFQQAVDGEAGPAEQPTPPLPRRTGKRNRPAAGLPSGCSGWRRLSTGCG
jgi:hypothetical protein